MLIALALLVSINVFGQKSQDFYKTLSKDGAWCWFSDPRAIYVEGRSKQVIGGWVSTDGSIMVGSYNTETKQIKEVNLHPKFVKDDHANPSFLLLPDKRIMVFYSPHGGEGSKNYFRVTKNPEDISEWQEVQTYSKNSVGWRGFTYTNPIMLSKENNRIFLFWRGGDSKPTFIYSDDLGKTWSDILTLVSSNGVVSNRPYIKYTTNGKDEIHFAFTDGHPRDEPLNSIYYLKYKGGKFYKANGTEIGTMKTLPLKHEMCDLVYDAKALYEKTRFGVRAWIWDIALDAAGKPILVYTRLPEETTHQYWYARWNGTIWEDYKICNAGSSFPRQYEKKEDRINEPHYSGGINIDHENPNTVYLSRPVNNVFEIFKYETADNGKTWTSVAVTQNSKKDNVRPFAIRGMDSSKELQILWMQNDRYPGFTDYNSQIKLGLLKEKPAANLTKQAVNDAMSVVANWQMKETEGRETADWTYGALYSGMVEYAKATNDTTCFNWLKSVGDKLRWAQKLDANPDMRYHADDYAVGMMYAEMSRVFNNKSMYRPIERYFDFILKYPSQRDLKHTFEPGNYCTERWSWCDALFMGPTVWAKMANITGKKTYLEFMDKEYQLSYNYLYNKEHHLFFRDDEYFSKKEKNGQPVFWGRGNGWVLAGLPLIIKELPADFKNKKFYENLFVEMAKKIASLQDKNGYWHASLLDPESYPNPEMSCTGFYVYALAWGINNGYLNKAKYQPVVEKGWQSMIKSVFPNGKLGWVQPVGADPQKVTEDMTAVYGVGAFLLAGTELTKLVKNR